MNKRCNKREIKASEICFAQGCGIYCPSCYPNSNIHIQPWHAVNEKLSFMNTTKSTQRKRRPGDHNSSPFPGIQFRALLFPFQRGSRCWLNRTFRGHVNVPDLPQRDTTFNLWGLVRARPPNNCTSALWKMLLTRANTTSLPPTAPFINLCICGNNSIGSSPLVRH